MVATYSVIGPMRGDHSVQRHTLLLQVFLCLMIPGLWRGKAPPVRSIKETIRICEC